MTLDSTGRFSVGLPFRAGLRSTINFIHEVTLKGQVQDEALIELGASRTMV